MILAGCTGEPEPIPTVTTTATVTATVTAAPVERTPQACIEAIAAAVERDEIMMELATAGQDFVQESGAAVQVTALLGATGVDQYTAAVEKYSATIRNLTARLSTNTFGEQTKNCLAAQN